VVHRPSESVSWAEAVLIAGSEEQLKALQNYKTWKGWERRGRVPVSSLAPALLAWWRAGPAERLGNLDRFRDFTARVAGHKQLRKVVMALADDLERDFFEAVMGEAAR
jgi:hypothetical protein